jgi:hypothetical protein
MEGMAAERSKFRAPVRAAALLLIFGDWLSGPAVADQLVRPQAVERNQPIEVVYRFEQPATGSGFLDVDWNDVDGRLVEQRRIPFELADAPQVGFSLDARRAVTMKNLLTVDLSLDGVDQLGNRFHREHRETGSFIASPSDIPWWDYQIIMWQVHDRAGYAALKRLGVTAGMLPIHQASHNFVPRSIEPLLDADLRFYLENIATDFYSSYHKWSGDRPVNWRFLAAKQRYWENPLDLAAVIREPSLSDRDWLEEVSDRLIRNVRGLQPYRPLFYNLGDEPGIADLAAFWDFDFSEASLTGMRGWLQERYGSLDALNQEWDSYFSRWEEVMPMTTREALQRSDGNFAAWSDFKEWMDVAFARAIERGTAAVHAADPEAIAAIEGAQIPGWGGYDYSRLAASVDAMEIYDFGDNVGIARSFNPKLIMLLTTGGHGPYENHRLWRETLRGFRGLILWDEKNEFVDNNGQVGEWGRKAAPYFAEMRGGLGALLINSRRHIDPIAVLYSPASMRVQWLLDRKTTGEDWTRRSASAEYQGDAIRTATRDFARLVEHRGLQHRFLSSADVGRGELRRGDYRILMLPHTIALSAAEAKEIRDFVERGGVALAEGEPGLFDEHGRRLARPLLSEVFPGLVTRSTTSFAFGKGKAIYLPLSDHRGRRGRQPAAEILDAAGVRPSFPLLRADGSVADDVETKIFDNGAVTIVALQRDFPGTQEAGPGSIPSGSEEVALALPRQFFVYDLRKGRLVGSTDRVPVALAPVEPVLLALSEKPLAPLSVSGPRATRRGANAEISAFSSSPAAFDVIHLDAVDPEGNTVAHYSGNLLVTGARTTKLVPFAVNDKPGVWKICVKDLLGGATATAELVVEP